jgi:hypothetical protein
LAADGASDKVLLPVITWSIKQCKAVPVVEQWVDFGRIPRRPDPAQRLRTASDLYPCEVLFIHRDAEAQAPELRRQEIAEALRGSSIPHIPVIPVRMTEAWLLAHETAIRSAAGNPNGAESLNLPDVRRLENLPDPKRVLYDALKAASGLNSRRRSRLPVDRLVQFIPNYIDGYSRLIVLSAFRMLQADIRALFANGNLGE